MKKISLLFYCFNLFLFFGQTPSNDPTWQLVWKEDFNAIDPNKWTVIDWADGNPSTIFMASNVTTNDGNLVLTARNNPINCYYGHPGTVWGARDTCRINKTYPYNSGWIETSQAFNTQFGYIESRIKLPFAKGYFPAFWTYQHTNPGQSSSNEAEIDIFEMINIAEFFSPHILTTNIHTHYPDANLDRKGITPINYSYTDWHTYAIEWSPSKIIWYVDGVPIRFFDNHLIIDPIRIIFDFSLESEPSIGPDSSTPFPAQMLVDFVKVYKLNNDCSTSLNLCNYNFGTHDNRVKKEITIGNNTCDNHLISGQNVYLRASESIIINGDFTVPIGSELYIDVNNCY